jgi:glycine cleavage system H protein
LYSCAARFFGLVVAAESISVRNDSNGNLEFVNSFFELIFYSRGETMVAIFVVLMILVFLTVDYFVLRSQRKRLAQGELVRHVGLVPVPIDESILPRRLRYPVHDKGFALPHGLFFDRGHTWLRLRPSGEVRIGVDDFAQALLGRIDAIEMPAVGRELKRGAVILRLKQGSRSVAFVSPVEGVVTTVNESLLRSAEALKQTSYQQNWLVTVKPTGLSAALKHLLVAEDAAEWLKGELRRFRDFVSGIAPQVALVGETLQDGGHPVDGLLERMDDQVWEKFERDFLRA